MNEFAIDWIRGAEYASVTAPSGSALKSRLYKLAEKHPSDVQILAENKDGSIFAHIPVSYVKISPPKQMSEEQRAAASERFRTMWEEKRENVEKSF